MPVQPEQQQVMPVQPEQQQVMPVQPVQQQVMPVQPEQQQVMPVQPVQQQVMPVQPEQLEQERIRSRKHTVKVSTYAMNDLEEMGYYREEDGMERHDRKNYYRFVHAMDDHVIMVAKAEDKYVMVVDEDFVPVPIKTHEAWDELMAKMIPSQEEKRHGQHVASLIRGEEKKAKKQKLADPVPAEPELEPAPAQPIPIPAPAPAYEVVDLTNDDN
jgi:hypothetical protein